MFLYISCTPLMMYILENQFFKFINIKRKVLNSTFIDAPRNIQMMIRSLVLFICTINGSFGSTFNIKREKNNWKNLKRQVYTRHELSHWKAEKIIVHLDQSQLSIIGSWPIRAEYYSTSLHWTSTLPSQSGTRLESSVSSS